jgi:hypothetical protein
MLALRGRSAGIGAIGARRLPRYETMRKPGSSTATALAGRSSCTTAFGPRALAEVPDIEAGADGRGARNLDAPVDETSTACVPGALSASSEPHPAAFMVLERAAKIGLDVLHASILQSVLHCRRRAP